MNGDRCSKCGRLFMNLLRTCELCGYSEPGLDEREYAAQEAAEEIRRINLWELVKHPRLLAAAWFAGAGAIPGLLVILLASYDGTAPPLIIFGLWIATILIAGVYGAALGALILDPSRVGTGSQAFLQGGVVAGFSFVTFVFLFSLYFGLQPGPFDFFTAFFIFMLYGSLLFGWLVLLIGGLTGWLLFRKYRLGVVD
jgi:hypothetical protein